jgi:hypothetical protein
MPGSSPFTFARSHTVSVGFDEIQFGVLPREINTSLIPLIFRAASNSSRPVKSKLLLAGFMSAHCVLHVPQIRKVPAGASNNGKSSGAESHPATCD